VLALGVGSGCAALHDQFRETGPSITESLDSPTAKVILAHQDTAGARARDWQPSHAPCEEVGVVHGPLYYEDPFEDKGSANDAQCLGGEDIIAAPYGFARFWLNTLGLPVSMVVTPPWTPMLSDGRLSQQALGMDHDPARATPDEVQAARN
jgi:hypothetical protein